MGLTQVDVRIYYMTWVIANAWLLGLVSRLVQLEHLVRCDLGAHGLRLLHVLVMYLPILLVVLPEEDLRAVRRGKSLRLGVALCVDEVRAEVLDAS